MNPAPIVSVVLPTYNRMQMLPRAIASALAQSWNDFELLVVDDASTDGTASLLQAIPDPRLRCIKHSYNRGVAAARNTGIENARGQYVAFLDSDDEWLANKLGCQVAALEAAGSECGLALTRLLRWDRLNVLELPPRMTWTQNAEGLRQRIRRQNYALTTGWLVRRSVFNEIGLFDEKLPPLEDWEWLIRYCDRYILTLVPEVLAVIYESPDSISIHHANYVRALEGIIRKHEDYLRKDPVSFSDLYYVLAKKYALYLDTKRARAFFRLAFLLNPLDARIWLGLILSLLGRNAFNAVWRSVRQLKGYVA